MRTIRRAWVAAAFVGMAVVVGGCGLGRGDGGGASSGDPEADQRAEMHVGPDGNKGSEKPLYERLGGRKTIDALVEDMTARIIADPRVNFERQDVKVNWVGRHYRPWDPNDTNLALFKQHMTEFLMLAAGGPAEYSGRDMRAVHKGMRISNTEFDAMVGDIKTSMDRLDIGRTEKRDLLAVIETTRKEIVEKQ